MLHRCLFICFLSSVSSFSSDVLWWAHCQSSPSALLRPALHHIPAKTAKEASSIWPSSFWQLAQRPLPRSYEFGHACLGAVRGRQRCLQSGRLLPQHGTQRLDQRITSRVQWQILGALTLRRKLCILPQRTGRQRGRSKESHKNRSAAGLDHTHIAVLRSWLKVCVALCKTQFYWAFAACLCCGRSKNIDYALLIWTYIMFTDFQRKFNIAWFVCYQSVSAVQVWLLIF